MSEANIPSDYVPLNRESPYIQMIGPVHQIVKDDGFQLGLRVQKKHCNVRGNLHGGVISGLADTAMGYNLAYSESPTISSVTVNLSVDYIGRVCEGDWLEAHTEIQKKGKRIAFLVCSLYVGANLVARSNAVFNILTKNVQQSF